ncbi:hypothetical protein SRABI106_01743 [Rahnella aquatilis]|nr:hypothetical protein SRABI106_01743 [Rahnella aquatilis]
MPVEAGVKIPLTPLRKFIAHKQQFLTRMCPHKAVVSAQVGELLPHIAGHFIQQGFFTVYHFVVGQRQYEVLAVSVKHAECHEIVMIFAVNRIKLHIGQGVVHPAHIRLVMETQPVSIRRHGDARIIGRFFRQRHRTAEFTTNSLVGVFQEGNGFEVFAATVIIRDPLPGFTAVIAVNHGSHRIDTQAVNAKPFNPVKTIACQIVTHFMAAIVINQRVPVLMITFTGIGIFVQRGAVKLR